MAKFKSHVSEKTKMWFFKVGAFSYAMIRVWWEHKPDPHRYTRVSVPKKVSKFTKSELCKIKLKYLASLHIFELFFFCQQHQAIFVMWLLWKFEKRWIKGLQFMFCTKFDRQSIDVFSVKLKCDVYIVRKISLVQNIALFLVFNFVKVVSGSQRWK